MIWLINIVVHFYSMFRVICYFSFSYTLCKLLVAIKYFFLFLEGEKQDSQVDASGKG